MNGNYKGDDEIGQLMKDFHQQNPDKMYYGTLAQGVKYFKETEKGRDQMCEAVEKYVEIYTMKKEIAMVKNLMENANYTLDQALDLLGITDQERKILAEKIQM